MTTTAAPTGTAATEHDDAATTEAHDALLSVANQAVQHVGRGTPLGRLLADANALRVNARERLVALRYSGQAHRAIEVTAEADSHLRVLRERARAAATTTVTAEADRLCGVGGPTTRITPEDQWLITQSAARALAEVSDDAACAQALGTALRNARSPHGLGVAGAIARHALEHDWDEALGLWCQPGGAGAGGLSRGGWATVASWRAARDVQRALEAGLWPTPLADAPTLADVPR